MVVAILIILFSPIIYPLSYIVDKLAEKQRVKEQRLFTGLQKFKKLGAVEINNKSWEGQRSIGQIASKEFYSNEEPLILFKFRLRCIDRVKPRYKCFVIRSTIENFLLNVWPVALEDPWFCEFQWYAKRVT